MVVGDVLGRHYYSHRVLETLFAEHGAPGEPPEGNCAEKCQRWLKRCNEDPSADPLAVLGGVLEHFMDYELTEDLATDLATMPADWVAQREQVRRALGKAGLQYQYGGRIIGPGTGGATRTLGDILRQRDLGALETEFQRALQTVQSDPPAALTAACAVVEALCKTYIEDEGLTLPSDKSVKPLWKVVQAHLGLDPSKIEDDDMVRILSGLASVVDGLAAFRTHAGSAHGRGRKGYRVSPRHARLAVNAAHTLVLFAIETWEARRNRPALTG
jgi:hypothetical protein